MQEIELSKVSWPVAHGRHTTPTARRKCLRQNMQAGIADYRLVLITFIFRRMSGRHIVSKSVILSSNRFSSCLGGYMCSTTVDSLVARTLRLPFNQSRDGSLSWVTTCQVLPSFRVATFLAHSCTSGGLSMVADIVASTPESQIWWAFTETSCQTSIPWMNWSCLSWRPMHLTYIWHSPSKLCTTSSEVFIENASPSSK